MPVAPLVPAELRVPPVDAVALEARAADLGTRVIRGEAERQGLRLVLSMLDLTTLEGQDTPGAVQALCAVARRPLPWAPPEGDVAGPPRVAAVCVHPDLVATAAAALRGSGVAVASVAGGFPAGRTSLAVKLAEVRRAVEDGAAEIDMVLDRGAFLAGRYAKVGEDVAAVKEACGAARLKVILETGELATYDHVRRAARIALLAGADFLKTSTGKVAAGATPAVVLLLLQCVRDHFLETGRAVGVKAAGGIRTANAALRHLVLVNETCGDDWLTPERFRFGASTLLDDVRRRLREAGSY